MSERDSIELPTDAHPADLGFGKGGVPWPLMVLYLSFLTFFVWYVLEYQLPAFLDQSPVPAATAGEAPAKG